MFVASIGLFPLAASASKPNIVVIVVDDLGWNDLGCYGSTFYETPHLDDLARRGVRFTDGYAGHPVCSPTRAALLTGKNPVRREINISDWIPGQQRQGDRLTPPRLANDLSLTETTLAERLKEAGYATWFLGKWHLGHDEAHWPTAHGFDVNVGGWTVGSPRGGYYAPWINPKLPSGPKGEYLTDRLTNEAIDLIKRRDAKRPFLLQLCYYTVHTPIQACRRHLPHFQEKAAKLPANPTPFKQEGRGKTRTRQDNPAIASMIHAMDENVGRLIAALKTQGVHRNTVVFFTSDNGGLSTLERGRPGPTALAPLRAGKGWAYEGGIRVPWIVYDPESKAAAKTCDVPITSADLFPTVLSYCGLPLMPKQHRDGVSLKQLVTDPSQRLTRTSPLVWHYPHYHGSGWTPGSAIREGDWKLIEKYHDQQVELYNLKDDLGESNNLAGSQPERTKALRAKMHAYLTEIGASMPTTTPAEKIKRRKTK